MTDQVRVRFAPSPTGALHIGGAHTALFNWLWAKKMGGSFILRIEDTDRERSTRAFEQSILDGLRWMGLDWDEGPDVGGDFGPYRQAERLHLYKKYADELLDKGLAYKEGEAVLFRVPTGDVLHLSDKIYGEIEIKSEKASVNQDGSVKDIVLIKSDGMPAYNYAVVVDDHCMGITCVIRGEDHLANTPKQMLLYRALGLPMPEFAHLPMILGKDKKKLSKRHAATSVFDYNDLGYLSDGIFNFLALLGWSPGNDLEIFTREEAVRFFELSNVTKKAAVFDTDKLNHINQAHLKAMPSQKRLEAIRPFWVEMGLPVENFSDSYLEKALELMGGRGQTTKELAEFSDYFLSFEPVKERYDAKELTDETRETIRHFFTALFADTEWKADNLEAFARSWSEENSVPLKIIAMPLRWILTGRKVSPGVFEVTEALGKEECRKRITHYGLL